MNEHLTPAERSAEFILNHQHHDIHGVSIDTARYWLDQYLAGEVTKVEIERELWGDTTSNSRRVSNLWRKFGWDTVRPRPCRCPYCPVHHGAGGDTDEVAA